jgi:hypothetical protein
MNTDEILKKIQEQREQEVIEHFAACERIRKKLELPPDALSMIHHTLHEAAPRSVAPPSALTRTPLRLLSGKKIPRTDPLTGRPTAVSARPQTTAMRIEEIEILRMPGEWMIADVQVGNRSQFPSPGPPLAGRLFTPGSTCYRFVTDTIQTAMDFTLLVHYVGPMDDGAIFEAVAMGSHASY